ncbi:MAG: GIY-YIG nuclease family protein [Anaerolineaceae bacterium]|nr:GIY-YIG nuclease family protein [Anaerolineaceae bacterium]
MKASRMRSDAGSGSYALCLSVKKQAQVRVGKHGIFDFSSGIYVYSGSALGPGGVNARLKHHFRLAVKPHWHLDWLRPYASILQAYFVLSVEPVECAWSKALAQLPGSCIPAAGFGASDCRNGCQAHLIYFPDGLILEQVRSVLQAISRQEIGVFNPPDPAVLDYHKK